MAVQTNDEIKGTEKEFLDLFNHLCYSRTAWQVWSDLMSAMACTIANVFETNPKRKADREKEYERCIKYIMDQARKLKSGNCAMVKDSVVYEWAEDYYRLDDKALEEKKAVEAKEREKKQKADQQKRLDGMKKRAEKKAETAGKDKAAKETPKPEAKADKPKKEPEKKEAPKKRSNELEGQMDLFSMMGL